MKIYRERLQLKTKGAFDIIDVTADVEKALVNSGIEEGYALVYSRHTTCGVLVNERETGILADLERVLGRLVPQGEYYAHDDWEIRTENMHPDETPNAHSHLRQIIAGRPSEYVPVFEAGLMLGEWQRIMILELDQAKDREILIQVCGE
ncbi:MAG: secondary thiamine-phosphate synthase enzyme YjbQ [Actinomycetota bacterium]|jgi:secondary thiamine-phosphate synthase enzyme